MANTQRWVWFDVDDVLVDVAPLFQDTMDRWSGRTIPWQGWTDNIFHRLYGVEDRDVAGVRAMQQACEDDRVLERAPLFDDVKPVFDALAADGLKIGLITARDWHSRGRAITEAMVDTHRLPVSDIITLGMEGSKAELLLRTGTDVAGFVDDSVRHVDGCRAAGIHATLRARPWNAAATHLPRIEALAAVPAWLAARHQPGSAGTAVSGATPC